MPAPKKIARTNDFIALTADREEHNEHNDCSVIALALATGLPYAKTREALRARGRKDRDGVSIVHILDALEDLGWTTVHVGKMKFINQYPGHHRTALKNVTTHHPDRFPEVWRDGNTYLIFTATHVLCVKDGVNHDWTRGRAKRAWRIYKVVKK